MKIRLLSSLVVSTFVLGASGFAEVRVREIGVLGLMSHDLFSWDRKTQRNTENGRIDLSTIFDDSRGAYRRGGNPKNSENAPVYTITRKLVEYYDQQLSLGLNSLEARKNTVKLFHSWIRESFPRLTGRQVPDAPMIGTVNHEEQAIMRALHDILPGKIKRYSNGQAVDFDITQVKTSKTLLSDQELDQVIPYYNGDYDLEYRKIRLPIPFKKVFIDLKERDREFIETFTTYRQSELLADLKVSAENTGRIQDLPFLAHLIEMLAKGLNPQFPNGEMSPYMPAFSIK